jgi:flagellar hook-length control protein FliK
MSTTLSSATAAAKAAQAELTAPVAANRTVAVNDSGNGGNGKTKAAAKPAADTRSEGNKPQASAKPAPDQSGNASANANAATTAAAQPDARSSAAQAAAQALADAAPVVAPLFSQLLNLADVAVGADDGSDAAAPADADDATGSGSATAGSVLPAMVTSLLNVPVIPQQQQAAPVAGAGGDAASVDAISATATLNNSATRLNLAAAGVAVNPAAQAAANVATNVGAAPSADDAAAAAAAALAAAQESAAPVAVPASQNTYAQAANPAAAAAARQLQADTGTGDSGATTGTERQAPVADTGALPLPTAIVGAPLKEAWVNGVRIVTRAADNAAANAANTGSATAAAAPAGATVAAAGDERSFTLAGTGTGSAVAASGQAAGAPAAPAGSAVTLAGTPEQWQQPLRQALGDRLQLQLQRNSEQAVIRLEPPNMGSIEISIRHSAGALQVSLSASNSEVLRQLNTIGDSVRQDLSNRQFTDVAVTVSSSRAQADQGGQGGRNGQQRPQDDGRTPGRALNEDDSTATFAMTGE